MKFYCDCTIGLTNPPTKYVTELKRVIKDVDYIDNKSMIFECPMCGRKIKVIR